MSSGWTSAPLFKSSRGRYKTVIAIAARAAAFVARAICVWVAPPPSDDAYPPPSEARRTYTALSVRPMLPDGHRPRFSWLARPEGYFDIYALLRSSRAQFDGSAWLDGRPACRGALVTQGSPHCRKFAITVRSLITGIVQCRPWDVTRRSNKRVVVTSSLS